MRIEHNLTTGEITEHEDAPRTPETSADRNGRAKDSRAQAFATELDPMQRYFNRGEGSITLEDLQALAADIRARFPYEATE